MQIPDNIKILGHTYTIKFDPDLHRKSGTCANCCPNTLEICVCSGEKESKEAEGFLHELLEALKYHLQLELDHNDLSALSEGLFAIIRDNDLRF